MDLYPLRRLRRAPGAARVLERADQLLLLGVHRNRRLLLPLRASHAPGDVPKLRVPIDMLAALTNLGVALQAVAQSVQQLGDHRVADAVAQTVERHRQRPCALARPPQRRVGIAGGGRLDQRIQIAQAASRRDRSRACGRRPPFASGRPRAARPPSIHANRAGWSMSRYPWLGRPAPCRHNRSPGPQSPPTPGAIAP